MRRSELTRIVAGRTLLAIVAALALGSCGGGGGDDAKKQAGDGPAFDADKLIAQAAGPNRAARSGRIDGSIEITLKGVPEFAEPFSASVAGPFEYRTGASLPDYELEMGVRNYGVELSSVGGRSYISLGESGYTMPTEVRRRLVTSAAKGRNGLTRTLEQFGVAPWRWETDRRVGGTEVMDGVKVVRINTSFNAGRILRDANTLLGVLRSLGITRATGLPPRITGHARRLFVKTVTSKVAASWVGVDDHVIRQSGFTMKFMVPPDQRRALGGISGGTVVGLLRVTEVGKPQQIKKPATVAPFAQLERAIDAIGDARR